MNKFFGYVIRKTYLAGRQFFLNYKASVKFGLLLPPSVIISKLENIEIGKNFSISAFCMLYCQDDWNGSRLKIGDNVALNHNVMINADNGGQILIGNNVLVGPFVTIRAANHIFKDTQKPIRAQGHEPGKIVIEDNVWIGANVVILPNVSIGTGAVIAAGAVVTRDVLPHTVVGGIPGKKLKEIASSGAKAL